MTSIWASCSRRSFLLPSIIHRNRTRARIKAQAQRSFFQLTLELLQSFLQKLLDTAIHGRKDRLPWGSARTAGRAAAGSQPAAANAGDSHTADPADCAASAAASEPDAAAAHGIKAQLPPAATAEEVREHISAWPDGVDFRHPAGMSAHDCIKVIESDNSQHSSRGQLPLLLVAASKKLRDPADQQRICAAARQHLRSLTPAAATQADSDDASSQ